MYRVVQGNASQEPDVQPFINLLNNLDTNHFSPANGLFDTNADLMVARAPGRLDVMGGIADYSGSNVLEYPIAEATLDAVQLNTSRTLKIVTTIDHEPGRSLTMKFRHCDGPVAYEAQRELFQRERRNRWAAYVAGVLPRLIRYLPASIASGANLMISTRVPPR